MSPAELTFGLRSHSAVFLVIRFNFVLFFLDINLIFLRISNTKVIHSKVSKKVCTEPWPWVRSTGKSQENDTNKMRCLAL